MSDDVRLRPYDPDRDPHDLWDLKRGFELGLGSGTGGEDKQAVYEGKLTDEYGERYLDWVFWCTKHDPRCVTVAEVRDGADETDADDAESNQNNSGSNREDAEENKKESTEQEKMSLAGYVFVLPQQLAMIWDAAVLNEIYVRPEYRGTGVADDLMDAAVESAADQDLPLDRLVLDVDRENDRAQAFYDRHGFEHWGEMVARKLE
ncbi:GNAT family N-acetyltransferase [Halorussus caseinilyticus]|uniref:GNAT family N-acetyltransferase n=1 Tax=Halorussus caseinilyticus TaxID=3034025 RepID=UPI0023E756AB|nr:N-acetyltransferase [Halorussus sp. DT72]